MEESKSNNPVVRLISDLQHGCTQQGWQDFLHAYSSAILRVVSYCERDKENQAEAFVFVCEQLGRDDCRRLRKFNPEGSASFGTRLHAVVRNLCRDWRERSVRLPAAAENQRFYHVSCDENLTSRGKLIRIFIVAQLGFRQGSRPLCVESLG